MIDYIKEINKQEIIVAKRVLNLPCCLCYLLNIDRSLCFIRCPNLFFDLNYKKLEYVERVK